MFRNFLVAFCVFFVVRYVTPRKLMGDGINYYKAVVYSLFFGFSFIILKKWNAYDKALREQHDTDKAFH